MSDRPQRLARDARERGLDLLLVSSLIDVRWLTGFTGSNALVVLRLRRAKAPGSS